MAEWREERHQPSNKPRLDDFLQTFLIVHQTVNDVLESIIVPLCEIFGLHYLYPVSTQ